MAAAHTLRPAVTPVAPTAPGHTQAPRVTPQSEAAAAHAALQAQVDAKNAAANATQKVPTTSDWQKLSGLLQSGDFSGAWSFASSAGPTKLAYDIQYGNHGEVISPKGTPQPNPLISALSNQSTVALLAPDKAWSQEDVSGFYSAAQPYFNTSIIGYGPGTEGIGWGDASKLGQDATTDFLTDHGAAPDLGRFAGARPRTDAYSYVGPIINAAGIGILTAGIGSALGPAISSAVGGGAAGSIAGGAATGAVSGAIKTAVSGGDLGKNVLTGSLGGALAPATSALGSEINATTGIGATASKALVGAGVGAASSALSGGSAASGALSGGISGAISGSGVKGAVNTALGPTLGGIATRLGTGLLTNLATSTLTSPSGKSSVGPAPGTPQFEASSETGAPVADKSTGFLSGINSGLTSTLGGGGDSSLANTLGQGVGSIAPYAAIGAIGLEKAKEGQAADAKYSQQQQQLAQPALDQSKKLLGDYNAGTISPTDRAVSDTEVAQGQQTIQSAQGLSDIAQTAFANYNSGKLNAGDQAALDQQTAAAKQQVAQQLSSAGITDSTIMAAQYQQIDNNALISKQNTLNSYFNTGDKAYNSWLTATAEGQATIQRGMEFASTSLQNELINSMNEANIGINEANSAIRTQMTTDANYAAQVTELMGVLATAYARQVAGQAAAAGGGGSKKTGDQGMTSGGIGAAATSAITRGLTGNIGGVSNESSESAYDQALGSFGSQIFTTSPLATFGDNSISGINESFFNDDSNFNSIYGDLFGP